MSEDLSAQRCGPHFPLASPGANSVRFPVMRFWTHFPRLLVVPVCWVFLLSLGGELMAQGQVGLPEVARAEVERCDRRLREVKIEIVHKYELELGKLRQSYQKSADLEGALVIREEERRVALDQALETGHVKAEPRALREIQEGLVQRQGELVTQVVLESLPRLVEAKRQLTIAGRLDEALEVRGVINRLQKQLGPAQRASDGTAVSAEELAQAYQADRDRADKMYRGVRLLLSGRVWGIRPEGSSGVLQLSGGSEGSVVECGFSSGEYRWVQETQGATVLVGLQSVGTKALVWKGARGVGMELQGRCEGWGDGGPRLGGCTISKR